MSSSLQLTPALDAIRLTLHVLAACIWLGGQITMMGLLPTLRGLSDDSATKKVAKAFAKLSWPAYFLLILTGFWNLGALHHAQTNGDNAAWNAVMGLKFLVVALAGLGAWLHGRAATPQGKAIWASVGGLASVLALVLGVLLAG